MSDTTIVGGGKRRHAEVSDTISIRREQSSAQGALRNAGRPRSYNCRVKLCRRGTAFVFIVALIGVAAANATNLDATQPPPVKAKPGHGVALCPNPRGLGAFGSAPTRLASQVAALYDRRSLATDLRNTDRAWWPHVRTLWNSSGASRAKTVVLGSQSAASSGFAIFLRPACGTATVSRSLMVTVGPSQSGPGPHCNACNSHLFYVNRGGRPLLWFVY